MKPAWSIIVFTVFSGFGLGLAFALVLLSERTGLSANAVLWMSLLSAALTAGGLCSSVLHLANPRNAWRALFRLRSSWLSREGLLALLFFPALLLWTWLGGKALGVLVLALSLGIVFCTAMIYASLRPIRLWRSWLTPVNYILLSWFSGSVLFALGAGLDLGRVPAPAAHSILWSGLLSGVGKFLHFRRADSEGILTAGSATGLGSARVRLLETGHSAGNFLTREFIYRAEPGRIILARWAAGILGLGFPLMGGLCVLLWPETRWILLPATAAALAGLLAERWLFFAEARHAVRLYHGDSRV